MPEDPQYVVVKNGERVTGALSEEKAKKKADEIRREIKETAHDSAQTVRVAQQING